MSDVLVIGGTGAIGAAAVRRFAADGHDVAFTYVKAESLAASLESEVAAAGGTGAATAYELDTRDVAGIQGLVDKCGAELRTVVFSAVSCPLKPLAQVKPRHWDWSFDINAKAFGVLVTHAMERLGANRGSVIALTSAGSRLVIPDYVTVGATKAAVEAMVRYAAVEGAAWGMRANLVSPGLLESRALDGFEDDNDYLVAQAEHRTPLGRLVTPEEVAEAIAWLASDRASMITGQTIVIDGGWEVVGPLSRDWARPGQADAGG